VYAAYLGLVGVFSAGGGGGAGSGLGGSVNATSMGKNPNPNTLAALSALQDLTALSTKNSHRQVTLLSHVLRLRILFDGAGDSKEWGERVREALGICESSLGYSFPASTSTSISTTTFDTPIKGSLPPPTRTPPAPKTLKRPRPQNQDQDPPTPKSPIEYALSLTTLILGVVYYTHIGIGEEAKERLRLLHLLLDSDDGEGCGGDGVVEVSFVSPSLLPLFASVGSVRPRADYDYLFFRRWNVEKDPRWWLPSHIGGRFCY
jgi:hypothetical protein